MRQLIAVHRPHQAGIAHCVRCNCLADVWSLLWTSHTRAHTWLLQDIAIEDPQLRAGLQAMSGGSDNRVIVIINAQCIVQMTNQACSDILGWSRAELVGRK